MTRKSWPIKCGISGTVQPSKGHHKVIEAIGILKEIGYDICLYVYGYNQFYPEYIAQCEEIIKKYGIEDQVVFKGFCDDIPAELKEIDIFICASNWESFPQAVLEAMEMRVPVLTTPVTGVPELVVDGVTGYVTHDFSIEVMVDKIQYVISDILNKQENVNDVIEAAYEVVKLQCDEQIIAERLFSFYALAFQENKTSRNKKESPMVIANNYLCHEKVYQNPCFIENPIISIILPTYCRGDNGLLKKAIDSVLVQTFEQFELIVVDDGSVDSTREIMLEYVQHDNRVKYIRNDTNSGLPALRVNQGIMKARGEYFAYQFDDDRWEGDMLEALYKKITSETCDFVYGKAMVYSSGGGSPFVLGQEFFYYKLIESNQFANNAVLHHRRLVEKYGMYDCNLMIRRLCDWDLWLRYAREGSFMFLDKVVSHVTINVEDSIGNTCTHDLSAFRLFNAVQEERNEKLKIANFHDYPLDNLLFMPNKQYFYNKHIYQWFLKKRFELNKRPENTVVESIQTIVVSKSTYDSTIDITIRNFAKILGHKYRFLFIPEDQLDHTVLRTCALLILHRTFFPVSTEILKKYKGSLPIIYLLDDDLLNLYKMSPEFSYLSPDKENYKNLVYQLTNTDLVVTYSEKISEQIRPYNTRVIQLSTNILGEYCHQNQVARSGEWSKENPFRIAFIGGTARSEEMKFIWDDIVKFSKKYKERVAFYFWGFTPRDIGDIKDSPIHEEIFSTAYYEYVNRLIDTQFDVVLVPLFSDQAKLAKSPIKYLEATVNQAIGLYSDVLPYDMIEDGVHGIKVKSEKGKWFEALEKAMHMDPEEVKLMKERNQEVIKEVFVTEKQADRFEMMIEAAKLLHYIGGGGKVAYVIHSAYLGGAENHIMKHARLTKKLGIDVVVILPTYYKDKGEIVQRMCQEANIPIEYADYGIYVEPYSINYSLAVQNAGAFKGLIDKHHIKLIHCTTLIPAAAVAAYDKKIPLVNSLHAVEVENKPIYHSHYLPQFIHSSSLHFANIWADLWGAHTECIRSLVPKVFFEESRKMDYENKKITFVVSGTLQERKGQHIAIEAVGKLREQGYDVELVLLGYDQFFPDYLKNCKELAAQYHCTPNIHFKGFCENMKEQLMEADGLICASDWESLPQVILEAMAMKIPVITTPVTGVPELIVNKVTGYVSADFTVDSISETLLAYVHDYYNDPSRIEEIRNNAFQVVKEECNEDIVSKRLFYLYNIAIKNRRN